MSGTFCSCVGLANGRPSLGLSRATFSASSAFVHAVALAAGARPSQFPASQVAIASRGDFTRVSRFSSGGDGAAVEAGWWHGVGGR